MAKKIALAGVFGAAGFLAGGIIGAKIEGDCTCDTAGLRGVLIGAPIGAAVGVTLGVTLVD